MHLCQQNVKQLLDGIALADRRIAELQSAEGAKKAAEEKRRAEEDVNQVKEAKKAAEEKKEIPVPPPRSKGDNVGDINGAAIARFTYSPRPRLIGLRRWCYQNVKQLLDGIALADRRIAELQAAEAAKKAEEAKKSAEEAKATPVPPPRSMGDNVRDILICGNGVFFCLLTCVILVSVGAGVNFQNVKHLLDSIELADRRIAELQAAETAKKAEEAKKAEDEAKQAPVAAPRPKTDKVCVSERQLGDSS